VIALVIARLVNVLNNCAALVLTGAPTDAAIHGRFFTGGAGRQPPGSNGATMRRTGQQSG
jgi:hypothetical protein